MLSLSVGIPSQERPARAHPQHHGLRAALALTAEGQAPSGEFQAPSGEGQGPMARVASTNLPLPLSPAAKAALRKALALSQAGRQKLLDRLKGQPCFALLFGHEQLFPELIFQR